MSNFTHGAKLGEAVEVRSQLLLVAEQHEMNIGMTNPGNIGALDHHIGRALAAHGIKGEDNGFAVSLSHGQIESWEQQPIIRSDDAYATPDVSIISRPLYWPQEPQM